VVDDSRSGRHRTPARYNPVAELSTIVKSAGETSVKATAVLAASGGLVTSFALPAQGPTAQASAAQKSASTSTTVASLATDTAEDTAQAAPRTLSLAPAVVAPDAASPVAVEVVGVAGVKAVAKPKPAPTPVATPDRTTTTASRSTQRTATIAQSSSEIVNIARTLLGIPYVYGGEDPSGFDCSGFTQYVFGKAGVSIPRTASAQQDAATPVSNPQPGDLVFYGSPAWHVGIYTGNGMMIDSPREGKSTSERPMFDGVTGYGRF
jgi:cell wall-associated NlpC family hydrolase